MTKQEASEISRNRSRYYGSDLLSCLGVRPGVEITDSRIGQMLESKIAKAQAEYDEAVRYRPSYAPEGRPTATEQGKSALLKVAQDIYEWWQAECIIAER